MDNASHSKDRIAVELNIPWADKALTGRLWSAQLVDRMSADSLMKEFRLDHDTLVAVPSEKKQDAQSLFAHHAIAELLSYIELSPQSEKIAFGETPLAAIATIFESLSCGKDVLLLRWTDVPSGFVPAILSILSASDIHIEKVIFPVRQRGYELTSEQVAYLYGLYDAFNSPLKPG